MGKIAQKTLPQLYPVGLCLKPAHYDAVLEARPAVSFFEVHAENYMAEAGPHHRYLEAIVELYPLSVHGVGMSLGSADGLDKVHLAKFRTLVDRYQPHMVSEHLAWSRAKGHYLNDLLPLPYTAETLDLVAQNISHMQDAIGRQILIENPSSYMAFKDTTMHEADFLNSLVARTGCGLLLDVNNVFVSASNMGWSAEAYLSQLDMAAVGEIHLAGHLVRDIDGNILRLDDHGSQVSDDVWALYAEVLLSAGGRPTLIEWDNNIPDFSVLLAEHDKAAACMKAATQQKTSIGADSGASQAAALRAVPGVEGQQSHAPNSAPKAQQTTSGGRHALT